MATVGEVAEASAFPALIPDPAPAVVAEAASALRASTSVGLGLVPLGLAFGAVVTHAGLPWWCAVLFTSVVYAGSLEFLLVPLAVAAVPLATVALTAFLVNVRHVFYSLSFPLDRVRGRAAKAYSTFSLTDEAYALTTAENARDWPGRRIVWLQVLLQLYWVLGATVGALLSTLIPSGVTGLDFAMTALFTVLALDALRDRRGDLPTPVLAVLSALIARWLVPGEFLLVAFAVFTAGLLALTTLRSSAIVRELSARMPAGVMVILLCYCLRDLSVAHPARLVASLTALAATVAVHLWRRGALLSIVIGTGVYVVLVNILHLQ